MKPPPSVVSVLISMSLSNLLFPVSASYSPLLPLVHSVSAMDDGVEGSLHGADAAADEIPSDPIERSDALREAAQVGDCERVRRLLLAKASVGHHSTNMSVVHFAAATNQVQVLKLLFIEFKEVASLDGTSTDAELNTPLHLAARGGHVEALELLISLGADLRGGAYSQTPLHSAAEAGSVPCVKALLRARADATQLDACGNSVLTYAARAPNHHVLQYLLESCFVDEPGGVMHMTRTARCSTALFEATYCARTANVLCLLQFKADVNAICGSPRNPTAFYAACRSYDGDIECVEALVAASADTNVVNDINETALHWATYRGHDSIVRFLCPRKLGGDINAADRDGRTALHWAVTTCDIDTVRLMIEMQANVNAKAEVSTTSELCSNTFLLNQSRAYPCHYFIDICFQLLSFLPFVSLYI